METCNANVAAKQKGFTLMELVLVIAAVGVIGSLTVSVLSSMMRQQKAAATQLALGSSFARMSDRFRRDVHQAASTKLSANELMLNLDANSSVSWKRENNVIVRTTKTTADVRNDHFDVSENQSLSFHRLPAEAGVELLELRIVRDVEQRDDASADSRFVTGSQGVVVVAELGRDIRLVRTTESSTEDSR